jgi:phosphoribosylpyrophosphate synthetase
MNIVKQEFSGHLSIALDENRKDTIRRTVRCIKANVLWNDASIVVTGLSGMLIGIPVADALGRPLAIVRKNRGLHRSIEGSIASKYIIVDDLIETGDTVKRITNTISTCAVCVGIVLYHDSLCPYFGPTWNGIEIRRA